MPKVKLNKTVIASLPRPQGTKRINYTDMELPGFALRLTATGGTYYANKRDPITGAMQQLPIGKMDHLTPTVAREEARRVLQNITVEKKARIEAITGAELFKRFYTERTQAMAVGAQDADILPRHFVSALGRAAITRITRDQLAAIINKVGRDDGHETTAFHLRKRLSAMFNWAVDQGLLQASPATRLPSFKAGEGRLVLNDDEIARVWLAMDSEPDAQLRAIAKLIMLTGQRRAEVAETPWNEVDLDAGIWVIDKTRTKNGLSHTVPLSSLAIEQFKILRALNPKSANITWYPKDRNRKVEGQIKLSFVSRIPSRLRQKGGTLMEPVREFTVHNFRHTFGTNIGKLTENRETVKHVLNHKERGATPLYDEHTYDRVKRRAFDLWERHLLDRVDHFQRKTLSR